MSVIIRLQNLPWSANAMDIRQYFHGLSIPEGGVHIVGGELGDAFIAFSTDEDARQAFNMSHGRIREVQIKLMLSSRTEMQKVIEAARNQSMAAFISTPTPPAPPNITSVAPPPLVAPPPPSLSTNIQPTNQIPLPQTTIQPLLPAMVPEVREPFGDATLQNQQMQQKLLQQQLQQVQQQQQSATLKDSKDSNAKERRRSRSRSRDRRDRRRDRRRSRSRSRDRRERRRRERSRDRRSSSRERDRKLRDVRKSADKPGNATTKSIGVWENPPPRVETNLLQNSTTLQLLGSLLPTGTLLNLDPAVASLLPAAFEPWMQGQAIVPDVQSNNQTINDSIHSRSSHTDGESNIRSDNRDRDRNNRDRDRERDRVRDRDRGENDRDRNKNRDRDSNDRNNSLDSSNDSILTSRNKIDDANRIIRTNRIDPEKNSCVRLFPYYGGFGEIRRFFSGLFINSTGIKFALSQFKEQTGVVLVRFATARDKDKGLERNGQTLKGMEVQITNLPDDCFENGTDPDALVNSLDLAFKKDSFSCLVVEDLPPFTTNHHLLKMFSDYSVLNIYIAQKQRASAIGYIKFGKTEDAHKALLDKARHSVEGKRVRVGPCKEEIFESIRKQQEGDQEQTQIKVESDGATLYILLTDVPQKSNDRDVADFFSDVGIVPAGIYMLRNENGVFNGHTYCEFFSVDEARVAYQKKGMPMGANTVNMTYATKQLMELNLKCSNNGSTPDFITNNISINGPRLPLMNPLMAGPGLLGMPNMPMLQRPFFPRGMPRGGMGMPVGPMGPRGMMRMPRHPMGMHPRMGMRFPRPPHIMPQQPLPQQQSQQQQFEDDEEIAPPGCTLLMENVPFKAELEEILEFFDGFDVPPDNILRKYDAQGRPSGETKIIFNSPEEVFHVLQEKRGSKIRERIIYLSQC